MKIRLKELCFIFITGFIALVVLLKVHETITFESSLLAVLVMMIGLTGLFINRNRSNPLPEYCNPQTTSKEISPQQNTKTMSKLPHQESEYLQGVLSELSLMHSCDDVYQRYQCFIRIIEDGFYHILGPCCVTLWYPDPHSEYLVECQIKPSMNLGVFTDGFTVDKHIERNPYKMKLDSFVIQRSLEEKNPYLLSVTEPIPKSAIKGSFECDACIPLYRNYGQPLLVCVRHTADKKIAGSQKSFEEISDLIKLFWEQLQISNQLQWIGQHDPDNKILRHNGFLEQAEDKAMRAIKQDQLFSVVVVMVYGFRGMFSGQSQRWRKITTLLTQALTECLAEKNQDALMGKMADDVFAIMLPRTDAFIANNLMQTLMKDVGENLNANANEVMGMMDLEIQWSLSDHRDFNGSMSEMLDDIYEKLFTDIRSGQNHPARIVLTSNVSEVSDI